MTLRVLPAAPSSSKSTHLHRSSQLFPRLVPWLMCPRPWRLYHQLGIISWAPRGLAPSFRCLHLHTEAHILSPPGFLFPLFSISGKGPLPHLVAKSDTLLLHTPLLSATRSRSSVSLPSSICRLFCILTRLGDRSPPPPAQAIVTAPKWLP